MVGATNKSYTIEEVLTENQVARVIKLALGNDSQWKLIKSVVKPAVDGLAGFLGDHMKAALEVQADGIVTVNIFIKRLPPNNKPKADLITNSGFYKRERMAYLLFEEFQEFNGSHPWAPKAYILSNSLFVLPDLTIQGYSSRHHLDTLDLSHIFLTVSSLARFHAACANYQTKKSVDGKIFNILQNYGDTLFEPIFKEGSWLQTSVKLYLNFLADFSVKFQKNIYGLENTISELCIEACNSIREYKETLNVLLHKDLWTKNVMFKYKNGVPVNAMLLDFQCLRYGPPAFDLMIFLYFTTSRYFREKHEEEIVHHYYKTFCESLDSPTKARLELLSYDEQEFLCWCEKSKMFAIFEAISILPFVLMDPKTAEKIFDDPVTFDKHLLEDRSEPVISYAQKHQIYKERLLEVSEEFLERFLFKEL